MRWKILCAGLLASVAAGAGTALAADIAGTGVPGGRPGVGVVPIGSPPIETWTGFYAGIHGGGGWGHESFNQSVSECDIAIIVGCHFDTFQLPAGVSPKGGIFGFQFGHNWQWGPAVGGLEVDFSGANLTGSSTFTFFNNGPFFTNTLTTDKKIDALASVRGRLGYLIFPNLLLFGTAGVGWGHERINLFNSTFFNPTGVLVNEDDATSFQNMFGVVAGAGLEWKFANNWFLRGEWLHYDFLRVTNSTNNPNFFFNNVDTGNVRTTVDVARAAVSFRFGP